ncbi:MAG: tRNA (adenosine(37)-N6)-threonylcarbamoyltransferase complex dimerization subunit type 1 TsaB [Erythrobacter sp.]
MRTLAIETATEACSVALFDGSQLVAHDHRLLGRGHAEQLVPMIAGLPLRGKAGRILVSLGPGSFTGVRIGIATARALGFAWQAEVLGYPTLALVALMAQQQHAGEAVTVCMNGGHGEWFVQDFAADGQPEGEVASLVPADAAARAFDRRIAGNRAAQLAELVGSGRAAIELLPDARGAVLLAPELLTGTIAPIYGRGPDARLPGGALPA